MASAPIGSAAIARAQAGSTSRPAAGRRSAGRPVPRDRRRSSSRSPRRWTTGAAGSASSRRPAFTQPSPKPVIRNTRAPMTCCGRAGRERRHRVPVDLVRDQDDVHDGQHAGDDRDHRLHPHDEVEAQHAAGRRSARATTISAITLVAVPPPQPSRSKTVAVASVARMISTVSQPDGEHPGQQRRQPVAVHPERRPAEHHRRRRAPLAGERDEAARAGTTRRSRPARAMTRLPERDAEPEHERAVARGRARRRWPRTTARTGRGAGLCARRRRSR